MRRLAPLLALTLLGCPARDRSEPVSPGAGTEQTACGPAVVRPDGARLYHDALGRAVELRGGAQRIVSLAPNLTEILFAVGAGDQVVGVTRFCDVPPEAKTRPKVGGFTDTSPEAVVALAPDLILATADTSSRKRFDAIVHTGQTAFVVLPDDFDSTHAAIRCIAHLAGQDAGGERVAEQMEAHEARTRRRVADLPRPRVLVLLQAEPLIAAGPGTFLHEIIEAAGGTNVAADAPVAWPRLSAEAIIQRNPEVVITVFPDGPQAVARQLPGIAALEHGRVHALDPGLMMRAGPRIAEALDAVAAVVHPSESDR